ncbi:hypothetical protein C8A00DRAFT_16770 [Chaetomidium leptoderma]|uniref:Uncharacterized protein n=1 Tax=Chaetomidium leptoderma TaxID=669021 RepID=A0AAN6ZWY8_9PEZI|nr:hypothetical protein C8A00DRAFT_16770 [Chaetomidium leptoderma]
MSNSIAMDTLLEPPTASVRPYPHHCQDLALQEYILLQEQHELLRQHLDELRPTRQNSICTPVSPSPPSSPTPMSRSLAAARPQPPQHSFALPPRKGSYHGASVGPDLGHHHEAALAEVAVEEAKLCGVNEGMKRALTELLNCETSRADRTFRAWVMSRLMDTERELRSGRRRRSAPGP